MMEHRDPKLMGEFSLYFDLEPFYNRELRRKFLMGYIGDVIDRVRAINNYEEFISARERAVYNFLEGSEMTRKVLNRERTLEGLLTQRKKLRECYADYWSFDFLIKEHPLVERGVKEIMDTLGEDSEKFAIIATPGKMHCREGEFDLAKHIAKTYLIHKMIQKNPQIIELSRFIEQVIYAEGKQDWELRKYFFDYAIFGLNLLRHMQLKGLCGGRDPLLWLNNSWFEKNAK